MPEALELGDQPSGVGFVAASAVPVGSEAERAVVADAFVPIWVGVTISLQAHSGSLRPL